MKKSIIIEYFGGPTETARKLDYAHRNICYRWPEVLTPRTVKAIVRRMKFAELDIPVEWLEYASGEAPKGSARVG